MPDPHLFVHLRDLLQKGKTSRAQRELRALVDQKPDDDALVMEIAEVLRENGEFAAASDLLLERFELRCRRKQMREATALFERMHGWHPQPPARMMTLASGLEGSRQRLLAERWYRQAAEGFQRIGARDAELTAWQAVLRMKPRSVSLMVQIGERAFSLAAPETAAQAFLMAAEQRHEDPALLQRAALLQPSRPELRLRWVRALQARRQFEPAWQALQPLLGSPELSTQAGKLLQTQLLLGRGALEEAAQSLTDILDTEEGFHLGLRCWLGLAQQGSRRSVELARQLEAHLTEGTHPQWLAMLDELLASAHEESLIEYLTDCFERLQMPDRQARALYQRFDFAVAAGEFTHAADLLERALALDPYDPNATERLQALRGRLPQARWEAFCERLAPADRKGKSWAPDEPAVSLRDLILQAEIFLQYQMRDQAAQRLRTVLRQFPAEARRLPNLPALLQQAGIAEELQTPPEDEQTAPEITPGMQSPAGIARIPLTQIHQVMRAIHRPSSPERTLAAAVQHFGRMWKADMALAARFHQDTATLQPVEYYGAGIAGPGAELVRQLLEQLEGLLISRLPVASPLRLPRRNESQPLADLLHAMELDSMLVQPLEEGGNLIGVILLASRQPGRNWAEADSELLGIMTDQLMLALQHGRRRSLLRQFVRRDEAGMLHLSSWMELLVAECARVREQASTLTVAALELLHPQPERVAAMAEWLEQTARRVSGYLHPDDAMVRLRPDCWLFLLPDSTTAQGLALMQKLRAMLGTLIWPDGTLLHSAAGVAEMASEQEVPTDASPLALPVEDAATEVLDRSLEALSDSRMAEDHAPVMRQPAALTPVG